MPLRVRSAFFSSYTGLGGGETSLLSLLSALDRSRFQALLVCPGPGRLAQAAGEFGIETHIVPYRGASTLFIPGLWKRLPQTARLEAAIRSLRPQVVHSDYHSLPYVLPASRKLGLPLIFTCYGWWFHPRPWQREFFRGGPAAILAISNAVKRGFLGDPPFMPVENVQVLHLGVDVDRFRPCLEERARLRKAFDLQPGSLLVTLMARFQQVKGHDLFLQACRLVARRYPQAQFVIAGENISGAAGDEVFRERILATIKSDAELQNRVHFAGWVSQPEKLLAISDVVVSCSRFESFGMVLVEAMACGVPVVSTNVGGPSETVVDGETGFLVPPGQAGRIAERVLVLLGDEDLRRCMGEAGRARVVDSFSLNRYVLGFTRVIESLVS